MKKYEVFVCLDHTDRYDIKAKNEDEAKEKALSGEFEPSDYNEEYHCIGDIQEVEKFRGEI